MRGRSHRLEERNNGQPTDICLRPMEGADIYQTAKTCRTSIEMFESSTPYMPALRNIDAWTSCCRLGAAIL